MTVPGVSCGATTELRDNHPRSRTTPDAIVPKASASKPTRRLTALSTAPGSRDPRGFANRLRGCSRSRCAPSQLGRGLSPRSGNSPPIWAGATRRPRDKRPAGSTRRKLFARLYGTTLSAALAVLPWCRVRRGQGSPPAGQRVIAIDGKGKTVRRARTTFSAAPHLVPTLDHATGHRAGSAPSRNEIPAGRDLPPALMPLTCTDVDQRRRDAHARRRARAILGAGADYGFTSKGNRPSSWQRSRSCPGTRPRSAPDRPGPATDDARPAPSGPSTCQRGRPGPKSLASPGRATATNRHHARQQDRRGGLCDHLSDCRF